MIRFAARGGKQGAGLARRAQPRTLLQPALLAGGVLTGILLLRAMPPLDGLARLVAGSGPYGPLLFVAAATVACAAGLPRLAVAFAAGFAFGAVTGTALAMAAQMAGCAIAFFWARAVGREWLAIHRGERLRRLDAFLTGNAFPATLMLRLLPVGNNLLLNLAAGVSGIAAGPFMAATAVGYVPQTVVFALLGGGAHVGRGPELALGTALLAASAALGAALLRRRDRSRSAAGFSQSRNGVDDGVSPPCN